MKKLLALVISVVMLFSLTVVPSFAAESEAEDIETEISGEVTDIHDGAEDIYNKYLEGDYEGAVDSLIVFIQDFIDLIHNLVGEIMAVSGQECAFCEKIHGEAEAEDNGAADVPVADKVVTF